MKLTTTLCTLWTRGKERISFLFYWNKLVRGVKIDSPPVFIVGCGHSGTSLLLAILGSHSRIYAVPFESDIANKPKRFHEVMKAFDRLTISAGKNRWVEKTPRHIYRIGKILKWCPDARILLMIRDGRDVACSIQARTGNLEQGIRRWVKDNLAGKAYFGHPNVYVIKYEDLISNFELAVRDLLSFLNETYEEEMKDYHKIPRRWYSDKITKPATPFGNDHGQYRNWQINQPIFNGRGRWKKLSTEELSLINEIASEMLAEFGYT